MHNTASIFDKLTKISTPEVEIRGEDAFSAGVKFLVLLREEIPDDRSFDLVMKAWFRAVKDNDYTKFRRVYLKYTKDD